MSSPNIDVHCDAPDPAATPATFTEACAIIDTLLRASFPGNLDYIPYVKSNITPGTEDQDKVWIQLDNTGAPITTKVYFNGNWRVVGNGKIGEVTMFIGNPSGHFDSSGRGIVGDVWDGWAIMNGLNGTTDYSDRFPIGAHMNETAGVAKFGGSGWQTNVTGGPLPSGGAPTQTLNAAQTYQPAKSPLVVDLFHATGDARDSAGAMFGKHDGASTGASIVTLLPADPGNTSPNPFFTLPPFIAICLVQYIGII